MDINYQTSTHQTKDTPTIRVHGEWVEDIPEDLYIPPEAFEILLDHFEGPLDFLLYIIQKNGFDLIHLDIAPIANQYLHYINKMKSMDIELAADYMVMAALLADLKSRLLLPKPTLIEVEDDPRQDLIDRLAVYLKIKKAAEHLNTMEILDRDRFIATATHHQLARQDEGDSFDVHLLQHALNKLLSRPKNAAHIVKVEQVTLESRIDYIWQCTQQNQQWRFDQLIDNQHGRIGIVVSFIAILELLRQRKINIIHDGIKDYPLTIIGAEYVQ